MNCLSLMFARARILETKPHCCEAWRAKLHPSGTRTRLKSSRSSRMRLDKSMEKMQESGQRKKSAAIQQAQIQKFDSTAGALRMDVKGFAAIGEGLGDFVAKVVSSTGGTTSQSWDTEPERGGQLRQHRCAVCGHDGSYAIIGWKHFKFQPRQHAAVLRLFEASLSGESVSAGELEDERDMRQMFKDHPWWNEVIVPEHGDSEARYSIRIDGMTLKDWCERA